MGTGRSARMYVDSGKAVRCQDDGFGGRSFGIAEDLIPERRGEVERL